jgi:hypothetical protein
MLLYILSVVMHARLLLDALTFYAVYTLEIEIPFSLPRAKWDSTGFKYCGLDLYKPKALVKSTQYFVPT